MPISVTGRTYRVNISAAGDHINLILLPIFIPVIISIAMNMHEFTCCGWGWGGQRAPGEAAATLSPLALLPTLTAASTLSSHLLYWGIRHLSAYLSFQLICVALDPPFQSQHKFCPSLLHHKIHLPFSTAELWSPTCAAHAGTALSAY